MRHVSRTHRVALDWLFDRIMFPGPTELLLIGYLTESIWTPKIHQIH